MRAPGGKHGSRSAAAFVLLLAATALGVSCRDRDSRRVSGEAGAAGEASGAIPDSDDGSSAGSTSEAGAARGAGGTPSGAGSAPSDPGGEAGRASSSGGAGGTISSGGKAAVGGTSEGGTAVGATDAGGAGTGGACGTKTSCCDPADLPCIDGNLCPPTADYCCDALAGARLPCNPLTELEDVVCIDPCTSTSYGTGSCARCVVDGDALCSDPTWDDACLAGGDATCSDPVAGYRLACDSSAVGSYRAHVLCTCSPSPACVPTPCCGGGVPSCEPSGCNPTQGSCCSDTGHYHEVCTDYSGTLSDQKFICLNDCTGRSYGTGSCDRCVSGADPLCDGASKWMNGCAEGRPVYCSDPSAGYRLSCIIKKNIDGLKLPQVDVECACDSSD